MATADYLDLVQYQHSFSAIGAYRIAGRAFDADEQRENRDVAIVNKRLANHYWPGQNPIGKRVKWGLAATPQPWLTVVGVADDVVDGPLGSQPVIHVCVPNTNAPDSLLASRVIDRRGQKPPIEGPYPDYVVRDLLALLRDGAPSD